MSFTFSDLCRRSEADYTILQQRTDACSLLSGSYEFPCRMPASCYPQLVFFGIYQSNGQYTAYTRPHVIFRGTFTHIFYPPRFFTSFSALTAYLNDMEHLLYSDL